MKKELKNIRMGKTWLAYIGSMEGVLKNAGWWEGETFQLMGMTGLAFNYIIHKTACPSSVTVYDWDRLHFNAMSRLGIYTDQLHMFNQPGNNVFKLAQTDAVEKIRESINNNRAVIAWAPTPVLEFGIISGYDDNEKIFHVIDCVNKNPDPLLFDNLGCTDVPILYIQRILSKTELNKEQIYLKSLKFASKRWQYKHRNNDYACGQQAYDYLIATLEEKTFNKFGLTYIINVYHDTKESIYQYLNHLILDSRELQGLENPARLYKDIASLFKNMTEITPFRGHEQSQIKDEKIPELIDLIKQAKDLETKAMDSINKVIE